MLTRIVFIFILLINTLNADLLYDKIQNLITTQKFQLNKSLIDLLFKNRSEFYITPDLLDYRNVLKTLKNNGLLDLKFKNPTNLTISFNSNTDPIKSLKILNEILRDMGYSYYFTKETTYLKDTNQLHWTISLNTEYILDPFMLLNELKNRQCNIKNITRLNNKTWSYDIDVNFAKISEAVKIDKDEKIILSKPLRPYMLEVRDTSVLYIRSRTLNSWYPYIVFYDKHFDILDVIKTNRIYKKYKTNVPRETQYIKVGDMFTLLNIKRGLSIIVK